MKKLSSLAALKILFRGHPIFATVFNSRNKICHLNISWPTKQFFGITISTRLIRSMEKDFYHIQLFQITLSVGIKAKSYQTARLYGIFYESAMPRPYWVKIYDGGHLDERNFRISSRWGSSCFEEVTKNNRTICLKSFKFWRSESKYHRKTVKQCGYAPARGIFDYGSSAWTPRKDTVRNCAQCAYWDGIRFCVNQYFLLSETKSL